MPTIKEIKKELKAKGIKGITGKNKTELLAMLNGETVSSVTSKTIKELKANLKAMGVKGITGKTKKELITMITKHTEDKANKDKENDDFFADAYKQLGIHNKTEASARRLPYKKTNTNLQEKLAKQGLRGGLKKKFKI
jgi:uncharacterized phage-associated protein